MQPQKNELCGNEFHTRCLDSRWDIHLRCDRSKDHPGWHNDTSQTQYFWNHKENKDSNQED